MSKKRIIPEEFLNNYQKATTFDKVPSMEEWLMHWLKTYIKPECKPNTYANFYSYIKSHIVPMLGDYTINELQTIELQYYIDEKLQRGRLDGNGGLSLKTVKEHMSLLNNAFKKAIKLQLIRYNPVQYVEFPKAKTKEVQVFEIAEQEKLVKSISHDYCSNSGITVLLGMLAGMRIGEISALRINDIDFLKRQICIDESLNRTPQYDEKNNVKYTLLYGSTKSDKVRYVPMNDNIYNALKTYFSNMPHVQKNNGKSPLFLNRLNNVMEPRTITYHFKKLMSNLQISDHHFHCLRHTFATRALETNMDIKSCSKILGHATTQITLDRYTHVSPDHLYKEMQKMNYTTSYN